VFVVSSGPCVGVVVARGLEGVAAAAAWEFRIKAAQAVHLVLVVAVDGGVFVVMWRSREGLAVGVDHRGVVGYPRAGEGAVVAVVDCSVDGDGRCEDPESTTWR
jgi:hypothetical protein